MRKTILIITAAAEFYISAMYNCIPLMILAVAEIILLPVMFIISKILRRGLNADFSKDNNYAVKSTKYLCNITTVNRGKLPINKFCIKTYLTYKNLNIAKPKIYGEISENSEQNLRFPITAPYCGMLTITAKQIIAYDYLSLFSAKKALSSKAIIYVFPQEKAMNIQVLPRLYKLSGDEAAFEPSCNSELEIKQIREYREGEAARLIHVNQTAKTDKLWIKELENENKLILNLALDINGFYNLSAKKADAFYEILSALILGLLKTSTAVNVQFAGQNIVIQNSSQVRELLLMMYNTDLSSIHGNHSTKTAHITLNCALEIYCSDNLVCRFSADNYENEIAGQTIILD